jgi:hypothetical protein
VTATPATKSGVVNSPQAIGDLPQNSAEPIPACPACSSDRIALDLTGSGRCTACGWRLKRDADGNLVDALDWQTAGRTTKRRARQ